jgi:hypothetical protein
MLGSEMFREPRNPSENARTLWGIKLHGQKMIYFSMCLEGISFAEERSKVRK